MEKAKPVASVCFLDNRSISMDIEAVIGIDVGTPMRLDEGEWFCELIIRSTNGTVALQMLADSPERFALHPPETTYDE
ncbi:hypothetical protein [Telmatospirillum siberiense]|uniref:Uncharacterized protein n=1 Tax=Telmatospirillum siberiense TaxID=382514 RepID=A0A2N3PZP7_9PROT|nr:hypothetical protein [Telmatospirillum siberiense]PKU25868.1 hypothetical protein CWS72_04750 [Telmatospirillum siberiense]